jgi:two-component system, chemotaxis family, sensor kinase CheA
VKEDLDEETKAIVDLFFLEAAEHLERMEAGLLQLEDNPRDPELLATIFRSAHSSRERRQR